MRGDLRRGYDYLISLAKSRVGRWGGRVVDYIFISDKFFFWDWPGLVNVRREAVRRSGSRLLWTRRSGSRLSEVHFISMNMSEDAALYEHEHERG